MGLKSTLHVAATPVRFYGKKTLNIPLVLTLFAKFACHSRRAVNAHVSTVRCCDLARSPIAVAVILTHWTTIETNKQNKTKQKNHDVRIQRKDSLVRSSFFDGKHCMQTIIGWCCYLFCVLNLLRTRLFSPWFIYLNLLAGDHATCVIA